MEALDRYCLSCLLLLYLLNFCISNLKDYYNHMTNLQCFLLQRVPGLSTVPRQLQIINIFESLTIRDEEINFKA